MSKRDYPDNGYPSVTTALGVLRKIGLEMWFKYNTAKFCDEKSAKGKLIGTEIHEAIQSYIETGTAKVETQYDEEVTNALKSFIEFRKENPAIKLQRSEIALTSEKYKFNGTIDCLAEVDGKLWIADWKTGEAKKEDKPKVYDEYLYQVSAYVYLYNETHSANVESAIIVSIAKDKVGFNTKVLGKEEIDDCFNEVFLSCLKILKYQKERHFYGNPVAVNN